MKFLCHGTLIDTDIDLGALLPGAEEGLCRVSLTRGLPDEAGAELPYRTTVGDMHGRLVWARSDRPVETPVAGQPWLVEIEGIVQLFWTGGGRLISYRLLEEGNAARLGFWLAHIVLPFFLSAEQRFVFLHCSAVEMGGRALLMVAPSMGGKSTLAGHFIRLGHPLITDDKLALHEEEGRFLAVPSHGFHRPYRELETLGKPSAVFCARPLPIGALFVLRTAATAADVLVEPLQGADKFRGTRSNFIYTFRQHAPSLLAFQARLLNALPVFEVQVPEDLERLGEVCAAIRAAAEPAA